MILSLGQTGLILPGQVRPLLPQQSSIYNSMIGHWGFDPDCVDIANNKIFDLSTSAFTGTLTGTTKPNLVDGPIVKALNFDGSSGYIDYGNITTIESVNNWTISAWINLSDTTAMGTIIGKDLDTGGRSFWFQTNCDNGPNPVAGGFVINFRGDDTLFYSAFSASGVLSANIWTFVCARRRPTTSNLFVNGQQISTTNSDPPSNVLVQASTTSLTIGRRNYPTFENYYFGKIDDLRVYNRALDSHEIMVLYRSGFEMRRDSGIFMPQIYDLETINASSVAANTIFAQSVM